MDNLEKTSLYAGVLRDLEAVLAGIADDVTAMATCACLLHERLPYASWTGFYRVVAPELLRVGPYQGPLGCLEITFDRGVCGAAARLRVTQLVDDVDRFPGHIACDAAARSEIVVPIFDGGGELIAVLDIDSHQPAAFDQEDRTGLELIAGRLPAYLASGRAALR
ncbi:MAG TPA: GAF domain-containing protein [Thermoanaerobaculia bacterium]|jgi:GAF domain-containing protein|nr:GAF domain-containing protein [Thermoanaerobaculia bacterium]